MKSIVLALGIMFLAASTSAEGILLLPDSTPTPPPVETAVCDAKEPIHGPAGVTCCCRTQGGGMCCNETAFCGSFVPGCFCSVNER